MQNTVPLTGLTIARLHTGGSPSSSAANAALALNANPSRTAPTILCMQALHFRAAAEPAIVPQ
jgi:hypothetical protein